MTEDVKQYNADAFKARVETEYTELNDKLKKLTAFIVTPTFATLPVNEQVRLKEQQLYMRAYADVLRFRIHNDFK